MALAALLTLDAVDAANARSWLKNGHKIFNAALTRLQIMAGLKTAKQVVKNDPKANRKNLAAKLGAAGTVNLRAPTVFRK